MSTQKPIVFFDGVCHLCNGFVDQVISRDHRAHFQFASLQGETAGKFLTAEESQALETIILLDAKGTKYKRSTAVLRILTQLGGFYRIFALGYLIPAGLRDWIYAGTARNRYSWFGQRDLCRLPTPEERG